MCNACIEYGQKAGDLNFHLHHLCATDTNEEMMSSCCLCYSVNIVKQLLHSTPAGIFLVSSLKTAQEWPRFGFNYPNSNVRIITSFLPNGFLIPACFYAKSSHAVPSATSCHMVLGQYRYKLLAMAFYSPRRIKKILLFCGSCTFLTDLYFT